MAKSDSDSNGLRQDQPEWSRHKAGGLGGSHPDGCGRYRRAFEDTRRPSVTELSRLTSDPILTADRRGGILIYFGRERWLEAFLKASSWSRTALRRVHFGRVSSVPNRPCVPRYPLTLMWAPRELAWPGVVDPRRVRIKSDGSAILNVVGPDALRQVVTRVNEPHRTQVETTGHATSSTRHIECSRWRDVAAEKSRVLDDSNVV